MSTADRKYRKLCAATLLPSHFDMLRDALHPVNIAGKNVNAAERSALLYPTLIKLAVAPFSVESSQNLFNTSRSHTSAHHYLLGIVNTAIPPSTRPPPRQRADQSHTRRLSHPP